MKNYKKYLPILALVLVALGVNLDQFGIDLKSLSQGNSPFTEQTTNEPARSAQGAGSESGTGPASSVSTSEKWSDTDPNINLWHIFDGEINRSGKPVGFHSRPGGIDPANARLVSVRDQPNRAGVYTATIEIRDGGQWKSKFSSFFPDSLDRQEVIEAVLHAYRNSADRQAQPFEGPSGLGFTIQGYTTSRGGINTAFPVFVRSQ